MITYARTDSLKTERLQHRFNGGGGVNTSKHGQQSQLFYAFVIQQLQNQSLFVQMVNTA